MEYLMLILTIYKTTTGL